MKALTIYRPWTWAVCHPSPRAKRTENRTWSAPWVLSQEIAIHAGASYDDDEACEFIADILHEHPPVKADCPQGVVAVATVIGFRQHDSFVPAADDPWLVGPIGWQLRNVRVLKQPVPCKGAQGLWDLSENIERVVRWQLGVARV